MPRLSLVLLGLIAGAVLIRSAVTGRSIAQTATRTPAPGSIVGSGG